MIEEQYLGFAQNAQGDLIKVFGSNQQNPNRYEACSPSSLLPHEAKALALDQSPALYHWNNLLHLATSDNKLRIVYARGKDFLPFSALDYVDQLQSRLSDSTLGPVTLQLQPNQICNDACTFCCTESYRKLPIYKGKKFTTQQWLGLIDYHANRGGRVVEIIGGGEPTLHPGFIDILRQIAKRGMKAYLFTNGSQFSDSKNELNYLLLETIVESCVLLNVSLDGYRMREKIHKRLSFEKTLATFKAMEFMHSIRDRRKFAFYNSFILVGGQSSSSNIDDFYECIERQAGWVDSIHIQNDFNSLSHLELDVKKTAITIQRTIDSFFSQTYLYFNFPLINHFGLQVPYDLSLHNVSSERFSKCLRALVAPTVECGSNKVWPCGKYAGQAQPDDQMTFDSIKGQLFNMRNSSDFKNEINCNPCIHSSYNESLQNISAILENIPGEFYHFYESSFVNRTVNWPII
jgi:organic radical activating enzyme